MAVKYRVYIETSIISYLTAAPSRDVVAAARQRLTAEWWAIRDRYELLASEVVVVEAVCRDAGFEPPTICTPEELVEGETA